MLVTKMNAKIMAIQFTHYQMFCASQNMVRNLNFPFIHYEKRVRNMGKLSDFKS